MGKVPPRDFQESVLRQRSCTVTGCEGHPKCYGFWSIGGLGAYLCLPKYLTSNYLLRTYLLATAIRQPQ